MQICKVELRLISKTTLQLPEFAGSTIRGAFGNILRETVCVQPTPNVNIVCCVIIVHIPIYLRSMVLFF